MRLNRRTFLRGLAGTSLALPCLEIMNEAQAHGADAPRRFVFVQLTSTSIGHDSGAHFVPAQTGSNYVLPSSLASLGAGGHDVQQHVSVVSGLSIPWYHWEDTPPADVAAPRAMNFHNGTRAPIVSGTSSHRNDFYTNSDGDQVASAANPSGPTAEWAVGQAIGGPTVFDALVYGLEQGRTGRSQIDSDNEVSIQTSVAQAYLNLVGAPSGDGDPEQDFRRDLLFRRRLSALDLAAEDASRLASKLGAEDSRRMDRYFTEVRELETTLQELRDFVPADACSPIDDPGSNPDRMTDRLRTFNRLIRMAFSCDLSRSAMLFVGRTQSGIDMGPEIDLDGEMHELTHSSGGGPQSNMEQMTAWAADQYGHLVSELASTPDGLGGSILDSTAAIMLPEGGWGDGGSEGRDTAHSTDNMVMLVAGHAGGLVGGRHIAATGVHPTMVTTSAMHAVGAGDTLGEVSGIVPELFEA